MYEISKLVIYIILLFVFVQAKPQKKRAPIIKNINETEIVIDSQKTLTLLCEGEEPITWTHPNNTIEGDYWSTINIETSRENGNYIARLTLINASYVDVDYYYCHAITADKDDSLRSAKVYVYVRDLEHLSVLPPDEIVFLTANQYSKIVLPCRPTSPDVSVNLFDVNDDQIKGISFDKHEGYVVQMNAFDAHYLCKFDQDGKEEDLTIIITIITHTEYVPKPYIGAPNNGRTKIGAKYILNCTVTVEQNVYFALNWNTPNPSAQKAGRIVNSTTTSIEINGIRQGSSTLTINNVQAEDAGEYTCIITDHTQKNNTVSRNITIE